MKQNIFNLFIAVSALVAQIWLFFYDWRLGLAVFMIVWSLGLEIRRIAKQVAVEVITEIVKKMGRN